MSRWCVALVGLVGCVVPFEPPASAVEFTPPPEYRQAWAEMEQCSGRHGDFNRVRWFRVPDGELYADDGRLAVGLWHRPHEIFLTETAIQDGPRLRPRRWELVLEDGSVFSDTPYRTVKHEILHDLLDSADHGVMFDTCQVR